MDEPLPTRCRVEAWCPAVAGVAEVFHARIVDYAYPPHSHDRWAVLIVDRGAISYDLDSRRCGAEGDIVAVLPPGVIHDGRPAPGTVGFTKRVLYLDRAVLPDELVGPAVDKTNLFDPVLRAGLAALHDTLRHGDDDLAAEASMALVAERVAQHLGASPDGACGPEPVLARQLRALLDEHRGAGPLLEEASRVLQRSKAHLVRSFTAAFGVSPHAYLLGRRVEAARPLLLAGMAPAEVAAAVGFADQSHLTRHFKRHTSVTPGRYAAGRPTG